ncbi:MAG: hypothetical protein ABJL99_18670 [Aliishimia sp.]
MKNSIPFSLAVTLIASLAIPAAARDLRTINRMNVTAPSASEIVVSGNAIRGARSYWCAGADYSIRRLKANLTDRLYVVGPFDRSHKTVTFSTSGTRENSPSVVVLSNTIKEVGASLSVGQARSYCPDQDVYYSQ